MFRGRDPQEATSTAAVLSCGDFPWCFGLESRLYFQCAARISVMRQDAAQCLLPIRRPARSSRCRQMLRDFGTVAGDEDFPTGLEKQLNALPGIRDQASTGSGGLEHPRGRRKPDCVPYCLC